MIAMGKVGEREREREEEIPTCCFSPLPSFTPNIVRDASAVTSSSKVVNREGTIVVVVVEEEEKKKINHHQNGRLRERGRIFLQYRKQRDPVVLLSHLSLFWNQRITGDRCRSTIAMNQLFHLRHRHPAAAISSVLRSSVPPLESELIQSFFTEKKSLFTGEHIRYLNFCSPCRIRVISGLHW